MQNKQDLERISHRFDSYIKKVLKNYRTDYIRKNIDRWENECFLEELEFSRRENLMKTENRTNDNSIHLVGNRIITDEMIHEKIDLLPEKKSIVITLHYFDEVSDENIAELLGITRKGVNKRRKAALNLLKEFLENHNDDENE
nr:sigma-70 family RNA polymerase sigma factor [Clostridia bacterium]